MTSSTDVTKNDTDAAARIARRRSIAIALTLGFMVVLFYAATVVRFGTVIANQGAMN
ncbi:MAG: hypothetical protein WBP38_08420 [Hyphomicrobium sp.]|nr:hypothetical protein [Hyphomicrobium sp.]